jgi:lactaldehyde dehydrogenase/glycolaldehyde dehydrogenase
MELIDPARPAWEAPLFVDGEWSAGRGSSIAVINPADETVLADVASASGEQVNSAVSAAQLAQPEWAHRSPIQRGAVIRAMAAVILGNRDELAGLLMAEVGKPLSQALGEVDFAVSLLQYSAEWDRRLEGEILPGEEPGETIHLTRAPLGVVAAILPWNYPLAVMCRKVAPALLTGNSVVVKPSEVAPLTTLAAARLFADVEGLPAGVFNVVTGGGDVGAALSAAHGVAMITFTGHRKTGKRIMVQAAADLKRVALELGGKAPAIVWKDADLDVAVTAIVNARHVNNGQVCTAAERVLVHHTLLEEFTSRYVSAVRGLSVADPRTDPDVGPLASADQLEKTLTAVASAIDDGVNVVAGGGRPRGPAYERGYWHEPTVLRDVSPDMRIMGEETFGPVTPIIGIGSLEEASLLANASPYGLSAFVFSQDYRAIMRAVDELQFGEIYVNRTNGESVHAHHSGFKESGIGGEDGKWGLARYTQIKTAYHHYG